METVNPMIDNERAGTGFMLSITDALKHFESLGYDKNIVPRFDHFEVDSGAEKLFPEDFCVDDFFRFENTSDPDDQAIVYAISSRSHNLKGVYMESYGLYTEELSKAMIDKLKNH
ncbi:MAG: phosphoribosylpyrophosphate synthetase [Bdellovibrionota bacterium]